MSFTTSLAPTTALFRWSLSFKVE
ncbi:MAG: hypothetical protein UT80_C0041G0021, partial [Parcubacteria group bacterium GW2011_GWC1_40_13]